MTTECPVRWCTSNMQGRCLDEDDVERCARYQGYLLAKDEEPQEDDE